MTLNEFLAKFTLVPSSINEHTTTLVEDFMTWLKDKKKNNFSEKYWLELFIEFLRQWK